MTRIAVLLILAGVVLAIKFLPWYVTVGAAALALLCLPLLVKALIALPFKAKGRVLRNARAVVHNVEPVPLDASDRRGFRIDVTITPDSPTGNFTMWEPGELALTRHDVREPVDDACEVTSVEVDQEGRFVKDEGLKYAGPLKLRLTVGVGPDVRRLKFQYYFESFGDVTLAA